MEELFGYSIWRIVALTTSFLSAALLSYALIGGLRRWRLMAHLDGCREGTAVRLLRKGVPPFMPVSRLLCNVGFLRCGFEEMAECLAMRGYVATCHSIGSVAALLFSVALVVSLLATQSFVGALALPFCGIAAVMVALAADREKRSESLRDSVPGALQSMSACFQAGLSLLQTFHQVASEIDGPLQKVFHRAAYRLETGGGVDEALAVLKEAKSPELAFVAIALDVQHESGGSVRQVLDSAYDAVESQIDLARSLRVQTAQAKLSSRVVSLMPFALMALFSLVSPGFLSPFFETSAGIALLLLALGMQLAGILLVRRMLNVGAQ